MEEVIDTSGFYKYDEMTGELFYAPEAVYAPSYTIKVVDKDTLILPQDGWSYFNTLEEACTHYDIQIPVVDEEGNLIEE